MCTAYKHGVLRTSEHLQRTGDRVQRMFRPNLDVAQLLSRYSFWSSRLVLQQWHDGGWFVFNILRYRGVREKFEFLFDGHPRWWYRLPADDQIYYRVSYDKVRATRDNRVNGNRDQTSSSSTSDAFAVAGGSGEVKKSNKRNVGNKGGTATRARWRVQNGVPKTGEGSRKIKTRTIIRLSQS